MPTAPEFPLRVFYDGSCSVCAREIGFYRRRDCATRLVCIDITDPDFDPQQYNISLQDFMYQLHAIDQRGTVYRGVESFWAIWQAFPSSTLYGFLGKFIRLPVINPIALLCYKGFAWMRPYLPKRKYSDCANGTCDIGKR